MGIVAVANTLPPQGTVASAGTYPAAGTKVYSSRVAGDANDRFQVDADGTQHWGPGNAAFDTNLYRSAVGILRTDQSFQVVNQLIFGTSGAQPGSVGLHSDGTNLYVGASGSVYLRPTAPGSSNNMVQVDSQAGGARVTFYSAGGAGDTNLYRSAAGQIKTDGQLVVAGTSFLANGGFNVAAGTYAGGSAVGGTVSYGTGAPVNANGANGDIYFRVDGAALSTIYQRRAGAWVGIV